MKISEFLNKNIETLLIAFFNVKKTDCGDFLIQSNYRSSKFANLEKNSYIETASSLTEKYEISFLAEDNNKINSLIKNDNNISLDVFFSMLYSAIIRRIKEVDEDYPLDKEIALAIFILRGSADFSVGYYSVDIIDHNYNYLDNLFKIILSSEELVHRLNLNFRELQPQYIQNINKRRPQIRINLRWFYDNCIDDIRQVNSYKADILNNNKEKLGSLKEYHSFEDRLIFYKTKLLGRDLDNQEVQLIKKSFKFTSNKLKAKDSRTYENRNQKIVFFAKEVFDDICVGCSNNYDIDDRSFRMKKNNRYYFEINHVISFANKNVDVLDNLVKLCPTCHRALTPGRAKEKYQKDIIANMINSRKEVLNFVTSLNRDNIPLVEYVFNNLK